MIPRWCDTLTPRHRVVCACAADLAYDTLTPRHRVVRVCAADLDNGGGRLAGSDDASRVLVRRQLPLVLVAHHSTPLLLHQDLLGGEIESVHSLGWHRLRGRCQPRSPDGAAVTCAPCWLELQDLEAKLRSGESGRFFRLPSFECDIHSCELPRGLLAVFTAIDPSWTNKRRYTVKPHQVKTEVFSPHSRHVPTYGFSPTGLCNKFWAKVRSVDFELFHT